MTDIREFKRRLPKKSPKSLISKTKQKREIPHIRWPKLATWPCWTIETQIYVGPISLKKLTSKHVSIFVASNISTKK